MKSSYPSYSTTTSYYQYNNMETSNDLVLVSAIHSALATSGFDSANADAVAQLLHVLRRRRCRVFISIVKHKLT